MNDLERSELKNIYVNLKDHFDELWIEREKNITQQFGAVRDSLVETAKVLAHRLKVLNHAHEQSLQDRLEFAKKEDYEVLQNRFEAFKLDTVQQKLEGNVFYDFRKDWDVWKRDDFGKWKEKVDNSITAFDTRYAGRVTVATIFSTVSILIALVSLGVIILRH